MSVQFGKWNLDGQKVEHEYLEKVRAILAPHGPDGFHSCCAGAVGILYGAFHTTDESRRESQPYLCRTGDVLTWVGRLDNRAEFVKSLGRPLANRSPDVSIVAAAYEKWGTKCFAKFIGDWALSVLSPEEHSLILVKDPIGTYPLYYSIGCHQVTWSSLLDPLILLADRTLRLDEEYLAGSLSFLPAAHLTPYAEIHSVPPSAFVVVREGSQTVHRYWDFDPRERIRYRCDAEYEEQFRYVLRTAIERRLRSDRPILAELSGGLDSSSIVCMADRIIAEGEAFARLDTVSYYDASEPNLDDHLYFIKVEQSRGRSGRHIDFAGRRFFETLAGGTFTPFARSHCADRPGREFVDCLLSEEHRVVLSGVGGDEVTGGVPTPVPELQDLVARAQWRALAVQLKAWALDRRKPWLHLLLEAVAGFLPLGLTATRARRRPVPWLNRSFVKRHRAALSGYPSRVKIFGSLPSFQANRNAVETLRRQLACEQPPSAPPYEKRYPFLDRDLLAFLFAIPREQLVRPGQRRSLLRRSLASIVPEEVLLRRRKAFVARAPLAAISCEWARLVPLCERMISASLGMVDQATFSEFLEKARQDRAIPLLPLMRTLYLEIWLRNIAQGGLLYGRGSTLPRGSLLAMPRPLLSAEKATKKGGERHAIRKA